VAHALPLKNVLREDVVEPSLPLEKVPCQRAGNRRPFFKGPQGDRRRRKIRPDRREAEQPRAVNLWLRLTRTDSPDTLVGARDAILQRKNLRGRADAPDAGSHPKKIDPTIQAFNSTTYPIARWSRPRLSTRGAGKARWGGCRSH